MRGGEHRLFDGDRIGRGKGILEGLVERFFMPLALALAANRIVLVSFVFWLGDHLDLLNQTGRASKIKQREMFQFIDKCRLIVSL